MRLNSHRLAYEEETETVACFDLLIPHIGELIGGSVREERVDILNERMGRAGMSGSEYEWYRDLRRYGGAPHVGFGMGFERLVAWVGGIENVREAIPMPRWAGRMLL
jgi:asparaginyl-tRNA synthetase